MTKLVFEVRKGEDVVSTEKFRTSTIKVGNLSSSQLKLDDPSVSRMHCVIEVNEEEVSVLDLGSPQGTRVNGAKVHKCVISKGDVIGVGVFDLELRLAKQERGPGQRDMDELKDRLFGERKTGQMEFSKEDTKTAFKSVVARMKVDGVFDKAVRSFVTEVMKLNTPNKEVEGLLGDIDDHVATFDSMCGLAEGIKGKFDIPRAIKAADALLDELLPISDVVGKRVVEFRSVFDNHLKHRCILLSNLVKDMMDLGLNEENAMKIMEKNWGDIVKSAVESVTKAAEPHLKVTKKESK